MKQKVLFVVTKGNWGGAQKYVFDVATHVPESEYEVAVTCGEGDKLPEKLREASVPVFKIPRLGRDINIVQDSLVFFDLLKLFRKIRPDIVHLNSSKIGGLGALAARFASIKKIIFTVHGYAFNEERPWIQKKIILFLSWLTGFLSTDIIFISKTEYDQARDWPTFRHKTHLIYNGINPPTFLDQETARVELARILQKPDTFFSGRTVVGTVAELTSNKGLVYAIEAFKNLPDCIYIIIGAGELRDALQSEIKTRHLEERVFMAGFIENASRFLKAFDIFLLPSQKEGLPFILLEAGCAERPVVATAVGGIPELIHDKQTGIIVPPKNPGAIGDAVVRLASQPELRSQFGTALKAKVSTAHSLEAMVDKTLALYGRGTI